LRCGAITRAGGHCRATANDESGYCYAHDPAKTDERRESASRAGRSGGRGRPRTGADEIRAVKRDLWRVIGQVEDGQTERGVGGVLGQLFNSLLRAIEVERRQLEADEIVVRLEALERGHGASRGAIDERGRRWTG